MERGGQTGVLGERVSGRGPGWERIGELTGDLTGDATGNWITGFSGEATGDLVGELGGDEAETVKGEATGEGDGEGAGTDKASWTGAGEGHSGLLAAGERLVLSGFVSSGMNGSGKKRVPGDFTRGIWKRNRTFGFNQNCHHVSLTWPA